MSRTVVVMEPGITIRFSEYWVRFLKVWSLEEIALNLLVVIIEDIDLDARISE